MALEFRQSAHHSPHQSPDLLQRELRTPSMQKLQQVPSLHHLRHHVVAAVGLIDALQAQQVLVVHSPQNFHLILETVEFLRMGTQHPLAENLGRKPLSVLQSQNLVNRSRGAAAQLADGLETSVETHLAQSAAQHAQPDAGKLAELDEERERESALVDESESFEGGGEQFCGRGNLRHCQDFLKLDGEAKSDGSHGALLLLGDGVEQQVVVLQA
jgi:hypothetical protein